jgi:Glycosyl transferases group 1
MNRTINTGDSTPAAGSLRILMLSIVNPEVERNGASTVTRGLTRLLTLPPLKAQVDCLPVHAEPVRRRWLAQLRSLARSSFSQLPSKPAFLYSRDFRDAVLARLQKGRYDLVILNGGDLLWISPHLPPGLPRILVAHNIEHQLFDAQLRNIRGLRWPASDWFRSDCARLKEYELNGMQETKNIIFLSSEDTRYAHSLCEGLRSVVVPPVFDYPPVNRPHRQPGPTLHMGLLGNFGWWPNRLALRWFSAEVLPRLKAPVELHLFGSLARRPFWADRRIQAHGTVEPIEEVWSRCDFMVCPVFSTGGVCVKLAEAAYNRMPALATTHAARGLSLEQDPALVFADGADQWVDFLHSPAARELAGQRVSEATSARFAAGAHQETLQRFVKEVISGSR